ncbi:MAG TPA: TrbI/VirB10 family protein [Rhodanobacteraceae bacterium]|nr:TrbI/VirB10 family protein [Rhodanobacteraceae bacterium]
MFFSDNGSPQGKKKARTIENILTGADTREMGLSGIAKDLENTRRELNTLRDQLSKNAPGADPEKDRQISEMQSALAALRQRIDSQAQNPPPVAASSAPGTVGQAPLSAPPGTVWNGQNPAAPQTALPAPNKPARVYEIDSDTDPAPKARSGSTDAKEAKAQAEKTAKVYLPRGTMMQGVTITGLDAPTGRGSNQDPIPVLVRIKHEAILPNLYRADYRECFALLSGYGDLSSERAYLRSVGLSCVRSDGKVIDANIEMVAIGEDGKAGMRGRFVSKQGQAIAKAAVAGFAQSYAQAFRPNGSYGGFGATGNGGFGETQAESGFYGGASSALDRVAKFYIDYANQMFPVVEVDAGRPVTLVVVRGSELQVASK